MGRRPKDAPQASAHEPEPVERPAPHTPRYDHKLRWRRFAEVYAMTLNATQAALRAGYNPDSAARSGHRLTREPTVQQWIKEFEAQRRALADVEDQEIIAELKAIAFSDLRDYVDVTPEGVIKIKPLHHIDGIAAKAVQEIYMGQHGPRLRLHSKRHALERLGAWKGLWREEGARRSPGDDVSPLTDEQLARIIAEDGGGSEPQGNGSGGDPEPPAGKGKLRGVH